MTRLSILRPSKGRRHKAAKSCRISPETVTTLEEHGAAGHRSLRWRGWHAARDSAEAEAAQVGVTGRRTDAAVVVAQLQQEEPVGSGPVASPSAERLQAPPRSRKPACAC